MANLMDFDTDNLWDDSASIAPSNLAGQYGIHDALHGSGFTRERSPPNPGRNKRQRIDADDAPPTESLLFAGANNIDDELRALFNIDPSLFDFDTSPRVPGPAVGDSTQFALTLSTPAFPVPTPALTPGPAADYLAVLAPAPPAPAPAPAPDDRDDYLIPSDADQEDLLKLSGRSKKWKHWMKHRCIRRLTGPGYPDGLQIALGRGVTGAVKIAFLNKFAVSEFNDTRDGSAIGYQVGRINQRYENVCDFHAYLDILKATVGPTGKTEEIGKFDYDHDLPEELALDHIRYQIHQVKLIFNFRPGTAREYYAWTSDKSEGLFALMHKALMYESSVNDRLSTITFGDSLVPQADISTPPLHSSNTVHREVRPIIADDEQSSNHPTEVSSFVPSNPGSGLHSHPHVSSGTPPTSAPRHNQQPIRRPSVLANSITNEAASSPDANFLLSRIANVENTINHRQATLLNTSAEAEEGERRLAEYATVHELARNELKDELANARLNREADLAMAMKMIDNPKTEAEGLLLFNKTTKANKEAAAINFEARLKKQMDVVSRRMNIDISRYHRSYNAEQQTHIPESDHRPPSAQAQSVVSTLSSSVQVTSPSRRPPSVSRWPSARPDLRRTATSRAAASPSLAPLTIPSPAPDAQVAGWEHQGNDSAE